MSAGYKYACVVASSRKKNEDRVLVAECGDAPVVVVADGAGGMRGGAADTLARTMAGETTAIVAVIGPGGIIGAAVGDSQAWVITETGIDDLTVEQKRKRLGSGRAAPVPFFRPRLRDTLVVGTDGLFKYARREDLAAAVRGHAPQVVTERLRALVQLPSGGYQDDVGVALVSAR